MSDAPPKMSERTLRKTLESIELKCDENGRSIQAQVQVEAERAGAAKFRTRLLTMFGGCITAIAVGLFVWIWEAQTSNALQDAAILQIREDVREHDPTPPGHEDLEAHDAALDRRVDANENTARAINERLDRMEKNAGDRNKAIVQELRRLRSRRGTWGG